MVEPGAGIYQPVTRHHHAPAHHDWRRGRGAFGVVEHRQNIIADRRHLHIGVGLQFCGGILVYETKAHLGGFADNGDELGRIVQPWHFNHNAIVALRYDGGFARTHFVDALAYHFNRLGKNLLRSLVAKGIGGSQNQNAIARLTHLIFVCQRSIEDRIGSWIKDLAWL